MGSKKNRRYYRNQHRFTFHRKRPSWKRAQDSIPVENRPLAVEVSGSSLTIDGSRIINIANLEKYISELSRHIATCCNSTGNVMLTAEKRDGLASIISTQCSTCGYQVDLETSQKVSGMSGYKRWEVNLAAVWGQMSTGSGHASLKESMAYLGVPVMTKRTFISTERNIGEWWRERLQQSMKEAGNWKDS